jgi:hypothetical protein
MARSQTKARAPRRMPPKVWAVFNPAGVMVELALQKSNNRPYVLACRYAQSKLRPVEWPTDYHRARREGWTYEPLTVQPLAK